MSIILSKAGAAEFDVIYEDMKKQFPYVEIKAKNTFLEIAKTSSYDIWLAQSHIKGKTHDIGYMLVWQDIHCRIAKISRERIRKQNVKSA